MREAKGEYRGGVGGGYARVHVRCGDDDSPVSMAVVLDEDPWNNQIKTGRHQDWIDAAVNGLQHALATAHITKGRWMIRRIVGIDCDTCSAFVAIATAHAAWNVCDYSCSELDKTRLHDYARALGTSEFKGA